MAAPTASQRESPPAASGTLTWRPGSMAWWHMFTPRRRRARLFRFRPRVETLEPRTLPSFLAVANYMTGLGPDSVVVSDFNGDGHPDLAVANQGSGSVSIFLGASNGTFEATKNAYAVGGLPQALVLGDFNGDGKPDL